MFGLAVLFFMAIFVLIAGGAMWVGAKIGKGFGDLVHMPFAGAFVGLLCGFMMPTGFMLLGWAKEKIDAETTVAGLCATKAGIHIYLSPEEHARRIRENDWEGVMRAEVRDRDLGSITFGKIVTIDGRKFRMSDKDFSGENGPIAYLMTRRQEKYPKYIRYINYFFFDVVNQVPLAFVEGFQIQDYTDKPKLRFWLDERRGCGYSLLVRGVDGLASKYENNFNQEGKK